MVAPTGCKHSQAGKGMAGIWMMQECCPISVGEILIWQQLEACRENIQECGTVSETSLSLNLSEFALCVIDAAQS